MINSSIASQKYQINAKLKLEKLRGFKWEGSFPFPFMIENNIINEKYLITLTWIPSQSACPLHESELLHHKIYIYIYIYI